MVQDLEPFKSVGMNDIFGIEIDLIVQRAKFVYDQTVWFLFRLLSPVNRARSSRSLSHFYIDISFRVVVCVFV